MEEWLWKRKLNAELSTALNLKINVEQV